MTDKPHAHVREEIPGRDELVRLAMAVHDLALEATYERDGESYPRPELQTALKAIDLMGRLVGILGDGKQLTKAQVEQELDRMGYRLVPKIRKAG